MMSSKRARWRSGWLITPVFCLVFAGTATSQDESASDAGEAATETGWNQEAATKLATELEETLRDAYKSSLSAPPQATVLQQRERDAAQGAIRKSRDLSKDYARRMRSGLDRDTSELYFRAVVDEVEYIWVTAGDAVPAEEAQPLIDRLRRILDELQVLYDAPS